MMLYRNIMNIEGLSKRQLKARHGSQRASLGVYKEGLISSRRVEKAKAKFSRLQYPVKAPETLTLRLL